MKKKLSIAIFIIFLSPGVFAQESGGSDKKFTDRFGQYLLGPVKQAIYYSGQSSTILAVHSFRRDGSREMIAFPDFSLLNTFDNKGRSLTSEKITPEGRQVLSYTTYDDINHTYISSDSPDQIPGKLTVAGQILQSRAYSPSRRYIGGSTYEYTNDGLLKSLIRYFEDDDPFDKYEYIYNNRGNVVEENYYEIDSQYPIKFKLKSKKQTTLDNKGRLLETRTYRGDESLSLTQITSYTNYDRYGNWTKRIEEHINLPKNNTTSIQLRTLEYYE